MTAHEKKLRHKNYPLFSIRKRTHNTLRGIPMRIISSNVVESYKSKIPGARAKILGVILIAFVSILGINMLVVSNTRGPVKNVLENPTNPIALQP